MSRSVVKSLQEATGKKSLFEIIKTAGVNILLDGNWMETSAQLSGGAQTKLVGTDDLGNKYYEDTTRMYGRHRWVVYKELGEYNASSVHPHWHAWLHCIDERTPMEAPPAKHKFDIAYFPNPTGSDQKYLPKGSWANSQQRSWVKTEFWSPP